MVMEATRTTGENLQGTLMRHCGSAPVSLDEVVDVPTPAPVGDWYPIPHDHIRNLVYTNLVEGGGFKIVQEAHALSNEGARYFGMMELAPSGVIGADDPETYQARMRELGNDYGLVIGFRNTHDKSYAAGLVLGSRVFICDNLAFGGEVRFDRKHTRNIIRDLPGVVSRAMGRLLDVRQGLESRYEAYKNTVLENTRANDMILRAAIDQRVIPNAAIPKVVHAWREPEHEEFKEKTAWSLFNAFTGVIGDRYKVHEIDRRTQPLHGFFDSACGIDLSTHLVEG